MKKDLVVIGGGAAGMMAAISASNVDVLLVERDNKLGGILNICVHNGFGLQYFKEELTGPEFASRLESELKETNVEVMLETSVIEIKKNGERFLVVITSKEGLKEVDAKAVILTSGSYERTVGGIALVGKRLNGIHTAGSAQRYLNSDGYLVGKDVFILGSGDIGLIMARRMTLEGAKVHGVAEIMPAPNGLTRNIVQCLDDFNIPLYLSHTVTNVVGDKNVEKVVISEVDINFNPIKGTEKEFNVDTLLLSVGLIPEINLLDDFKMALNKTKSASVNQNYQTSIEGLFVAGNALHIHDLVDYVVLEAKKASQCALAFLREADKKEREERKIISGTNIGYTVPNLVDYNNLEDSFEVYFRTAKKAERAKIVIKQDDKVIKEVKKRYVQPAEMNKVILKAEELIKNREITILMEVL